MKIGDKITSVDSASDASKLKSKVYLIRSRDF